MNNNNNKFIKIALTIIIFIIMTLVILPWNNNENDLSTNKNVNNNNNTNENNNNNKSNDNQNINNTTYLVKYVIDGDTFKIMYNGKEEKVRLIGIDTPESVHKNEYKNTKMGKEASKFTKSLIENKEIKLEFDVSKRDKYGRLLAYAYINDEMVNEILLKKGYARVSTYPPNVKYVDKFLKLQREAKSNNLGVWKNYNEAFK